MPHESGKIDRAHTTHNKREDMSTPAPISPTFRSDMSLHLIDSMGSDERVIRAAKVSTEGDEAISFETLDEDLKKFIEDENDKIGQMNEKQRSRFIDFLTRNRHGCYDDQTEVLTKRGWVMWSDVLDEDEFFTRNLDTDEVSFSPASRIVREQYDGEMISFQTQHLDLVVTPNHNMVASRRTHANNFTPYELVRADEMVGRAYRVPKTGGEWRGAESDWSEAHLALLGFFIGDGNQPSYGATPAFNIRKLREIAFLEDTVAMIPNAEVSLMESGARSVTGLDREFRELLSRCYEDKRKVIPTEVQALGAPYLAAVLDGMLASDGHKKHGGDHAYFTTSAPLRDGLMELCAKIGLATSTKETSYTDGKYAGGRSLPVHVVSIFKGRNAQPRIGWTLADRERQVTRVPYSGMVYCATVPNGTLFVRRNGKTAWSGNSPFEHVVFTFFVSAPIFVWREIMRHRMASYNEESGRYKVLDTVFYLPGSDRKLVQVGKTGEYRFIDGSPEQHTLLDAEMRESAIEDSARYHRLLDEGIAKEVARMNLPLNIYSSAWMTLNARSVMNFLSLRVQSEISKYPSFPQREIEMVAEAMEDVFAAVAPLTHRTFIENGRVAP